MIVPMLLANLQAFLPSNALPETRLSTWKRGWGGLWYVFVMTLAAFCSSGIHAQIVLEFNREWSEEEVLRTLQGQSWNPTVAVVQGMTESWPGVEVLDQRMEWAACSAELDAHLRQINPSKRPQRWAWTAQSSHGQSRIVGEGQALRWDGEGWQRLVRLEATVGASPAVSYTHLTLPTT